MLLPFLRLPAACIRQAGEHAEVEPGKPEKHEGNEGSCPTCQQIASSKPEFSPDLQAQIDAWPALPDAIRAAIVAMVRVSS